VSTHCCERIAGKRARIGFGASGVAKGSRFRRIPLTREGVTTARRDVREIGADTGNAPGFEDLAWAPGLADRRLGMRGPIVQEGLAWQTGRPLTIDDDHNRL